MKRIVYMVIMNLFYAPIWFTTIARMARENDTHTVRERYDYIVRMVKRIIKWGRVTVKVQGQEHIPKKDGFILFPNHQGLFDMLALFSTCPNPISVVIKKEASHWIRVKQVLGATRSLSMDRNDMKDQAKVILDVAKRVKEGDNFVIFAEGHRSRNENQILEFKSGTFKAAVKAQCPIVPVALINSFRPFDIDSLAHETVEVHYLDPIYPNQYMGMKTIEIAHLVHDKIQEEINKNLNKNALTT